MILSGYNTPHFHWNNLLYVSICVHMSMCSYLWVWASKSMIRNGLYPSASNSEIIFPDSFTAEPERTTRFIVFDLLNTKDVNGNWIKPAFRKLFNLRLKTSGNCKSTVSTRDGQTQRNSIVLLLPLWLTAHWFLLWFWLENLSCPQFQAFSGRCHFLSLMVNGKVNFKGKWNTISLYPFPFHFSFSHC